MPDSNRGKFCKTGLVFGLIAATAFAGLLLGYGLREGAKYERQANANTRHYSEYKRGKIAKTCIALAPLEKAKCVYEANDQEREHSYNQSDLIAQRQSALWAYIMGLTAVIGMALSALGVWLVKTTFDETRKANDIANLAQRPWISIDLKVSKMTIKNDCCTFDCDIIFSNVGLTVASFFTYDIQFRFSEPGPDISETTWLGCEPIVTKSKCVIMPHDKFTVSNPYSNWAKDINYRLGDDNKLRAVMPMFVILVHYRSSEAQTDWHKTMRVFRIEHSQGVVTLGDKEVLGEALTVVSHSGHVAS